MIIVTVRETDVSSARQRLARIGSGAGRVEIRLDDLAGQDWAGLIAGSRLPVIATCRPRHLGGGFDGNEKERLTLLREAASAGAALLDVELGSEAEMLCRELPTGRVLVSHHDVTPGTGGLDRAFSRLMAVGDQVPVKLAFTPARCSDCLAGRDLLARAQREQRSLALVTMGEAGIPGRLMALAWGSAWTYAAPDGAPPAAPGQIPVTEMADLYDVSRIGPSTRLTGLLGWPIASSLSPWMHNRGAAAAGLDARYLPFPERDAADFIMNLAAWGLAGAGVTKPHKEAVLPWMDEVTAVVRACRAINTVVRRGDRVFGDNTDAPAAMKAIADAWPGRSMDGVHLAILGAGGAARAVAWAAREAGARVTLHGRRRERAEPVARELGVAYEQLDRLVPGAADVLVNATPVGTWPDVEACPLPPGAIGGELVFDLVSNPAETRLIRLARERGIATQGGVAMLVRQGEAQFRLWHAVPPPPGVFLAAAREGLRRRASDGE